MKFASAVFGGRKLNAVRADAVRCDAALMICAMFYGASGRCVQPYTNQVLLSYGVERSGAGGARWRGAGLVVSIIQIDHKCLPGLSGNRFWHIFEHVKLTHWRCVF